MLYNKSDQSPEQLSHITYNPNALRLMRQQAGLSMEFVALASGLHDKAQISRFERGLVIPLATTLGKLLLILQPKPEQLATLFNLSGEKEGRNR